MKNLRSGFTFSSLLLLTACNLALQAASVPVIPSPAPSVRLLQVSTTDPNSNLQNRDLHVVPTQTPLASTTTPQATIAPYPCGIEPLGEHIQHQVTANIDYAAKSLQVAQTIRYRNETPVALSELVLDVQANTWEGSLVMQRVAIHNSDLDYTLQRNRMSISLPAALNPGCEVTLDIAFELSVPQVGQGLNGFKGYFGYSERQMNLGLWLATVAAYDVDNQWQVNDPQQIGEQYVLEQADWDVTLNILNMAQSLIIAAPGIAEQLSESQWHYIHRSARDFSISLSPNYVVSRAETTTGVQIELYHFTDTVRIVPGGRVDGADHALEVAVSSLEQFSTLFGAYPTDRMLIVQGDFPDGMEFSGLVFVSAAWFYGFEGGAENYLTLITVHEIAHQWWYARVGNDAANAPWLDEALSTYSEYVFYEEYYPELKNWWWSFRIAWYDPQGSVDSSVYDFQTARDYINAVYLRGAQLLQNLREDIGTEAFFNLLAAYSNVGDGQIVNSGDFWELLTPEQLTLTQATRQEFLRNPN